MRKVGRYPALIPPNVGQMTSPSPWGSGKPDISLLPRTISDQDLSGSEDWSCWAVVLLRFEDLSTNFGFLDDGVLRLPMVPTKIEGKE